MDLCRASGPLIRKLPWHGMAMVAEFYMFECVTLQSLCSSTSSAYARKGYKLEIFTAVKSQHYQSAHVRLPFPPTRSFVRPFVRCRQPKLIGPETGSVPSLALVTPSTTHSQLQSSNIQSLCLMGQAPFEAGHHTCLPPREPEFRTTVALRTSTRVHEYGP
jgi:hypothetical protein